MKIKKSVITIIINLIIVLCMTFSVLLCVVSINEMTKNDKEKSCRVVAAMVGNVIQNEFVKPIMVSETMCADYNIKKNLSECTDTNSTKIEKNMAAYLDSIRENFGYQMVFAVSEYSHAYFTYKGITKYIDPEKDEHDQWYKLYVESGKHCDLDVDTDEANDWALSVFVNTEVLDDYGNFIGVCGVGVDMTNLQDLISELEEEYDIKINLVDKDGLVQVDSDAKKIENARLDNSYFHEVENEIYSYDELDGKGRVTAYLPDLDWYLVVVDESGNSSDAFRIVFPSVIIFIVGLILIFIIMFYINKRDKYMLGEISETARISITDGLTNVYNRRAYENQCEEIKKESSQNKYTYIETDINLLKEINDRFGHIAGDEAIIAVANCLQLAFGRIGKVYRIGGDEFMAIVEADKDVFEKSMASFYHYIIEWQGQYVKDISVAVGVVVGPEYPTKSFIELREMVDKRMYEDKKRYHDFIKKV